MSEKEDKIHSKGYKIGYRLGWRDFRTQKRWIDTIPDAIWEDLDHDTMILLTDIQDAIYNPTWGGS